MARFADQPQFLKLHRKVHVLGAPDEFLSALNPPWVVALGHDLVARTVGWIAELGRAAQSYSGMDRSLLQAEQSRSRQILRGRIRELKSGYAGNGDETGEAPPSARRGRTSTGRGRLKVKPVDPRDDRFTIWKTLQDNGYPIWRWLIQEDGGEFARALDLVVSDHEAPRAVYRSDRGQPLVEVHAIRPILRRKDHLGECVWLVVEVNQRRRGYFDPARQREMDAPGPALPQNETGDVTYRSGCTFFLDPESFDIDWVIPTAGNIASDAELDRTRRHIMGRSRPPANAFDGGAVRGLGPDDGLRDEPFALLHDHDEG